jgi:dihydroorotate dehydrogenase
MQRFFINPPFGNYVGAPGCIRVMGSFTLERRRGLLVQIAKTLRPIPGGWVNKIGLRNKGLRNVPFKHDRFYSVVGLEERDWEEILQILSNEEWSCGDPSKYLKVEVNLGCPNVHEYGIPKDVLKQYCNWHVVSAKLPATDTVDKVAELAVEAGVRYLHCSNTLPTDRGGESGTRLREWNLPVVERLAKRYPGIPIIAGGGIYGPQDVKDYANAGAAHFGLSTVWFTPWRLPAILRS